MRRITIVLFCLFFVFSCSNQKNENDSSSDLIKVDEGIKGIENYKKEIIFNYSIKDNNGNLIFESKKPYLYDSEENKFPLIVKSKIIDLSIGEVVEVDVNSEDIFDESNKEDIEFNFHKFNKDYSIVIDKNSFSSTKGISKEFEVVEDSSIGEGKLSVMSIDKRSSMIRLAKRNLENPLVGEDINNLKEGDSVYMNEFGTYFTIKKIDIDNNRINGELYFNPYKGEKLKVEIKRVI